MNQHDSLLSTTSRKPPARCRLVFHGDTDPDLPREIVLERLRRLLKDTPENFELRMARLPLVLLPNSDPATARGYQRLLAQKGIVCRVESPVVPAADAPPRPDRPAGTSDRNPPERVRSAAVAAVSSRTEPPSGLDGIAGQLNLGVGLCLNPRGVIGRVLTAAPYRATLVLAAAVGLVQAAAAVPGRSEGTFLPALAMLMAIGVLAPGMGIVLVYGRGYLLHAAGRLLRGRADRRAVRTALAWSEIPLLLGGLVTLLRGLLSRYGAPNPAGGGGQVLSELLSHAALALLQTALALWAFSLLLHTLAEIQEFSLSRSFASILLAAAIVLVPLALVGGLLIGAGILPLD